MIQNKPTKIWLNLFPPYNIKNKQKNNTSSQPTYSLTSQLKKKKHFKYWERIKL